MIDANRLMDQLMKSGVGGGLAGGLLSGALAGAIAGGKGNKLGKTALKVGGTALVAGLAYKAWQQYQAGKSGSAGQQNDALFGDVASAASGAVPLPVVGQGDALAIVRAMIAAAKADGQVDGAEHQRIFGEINRLTLNPEEKAFLLEEFSRPLDLEAVVASAKTPELALELYTASRLVVAEASPAESAYLQLLAARLGLQPALVQEVDRAAHDLPAA